LGFAIPAETVSAVVKQLEAHGRVERGYLGITAQELTPQLAKAFGVKSTGRSLVTGLDPQGPAMASMAIGDVLMTVNSSPATFKTLSKITARLVPGSLVTLTIIRGGKPESLALKVGRLPDPPANPALSGGPDTWVATLGLGVADTTTDIRQSIKAKDEVSGLIVTQLRHAGPGALAGLKIGDLITHVGTRQLITTADIATVHAPTPQAPLLLRVVREGSAGFVALTGEPEP
jgi:serine protease Do